MFQVDNIDNARDLEPSAAHPHGCASEQALQHCDVAFVELLMTIARVGPCPYYILLGAGLIGHLARVEPMLRKECVPDLVVIGYASSTRHGKVREQGVVPQDHKWAG